MWWKSIGDCRHVAVRPQWVTGNILSDGELSITSAAHPKDCQDFQAEE